MVGISSLFRKAQVISRTLPKTGTEVQTWEKGSNKFKKVIYGEGNQIAKNTGLKEYTIKTDNEGNKVFKATYKNQNGDSVTIGIPSYLGIAKNKSPQQNITLFNFYNMMEKAIGTFM